MKISRVSIKNFRGVKEADLLLPDHGVLIGDNNTGKTTVFEALDLVLGPDRLNRRPPLDEHDFFMGKYLSVKPEGEDNEEVGANPENPVVEIDACITHLNEEQERHFHDQVEFWDVVERKLYEDPNPEGVDADNIVSALRIKFLGRYDEEEDDFTGETYFARFFENEDSPKFKKSDKQKCGFLYLRSLRTGSRALSLERGSLLDIILRIKEVRPRMWEDTIKELDKITVAANPELGVSEILESINQSLKKYVPKEWGIEPHLKVSNLTRENLRKVITAFVATGVQEHAAPFYRQGTGTINMLVLAMLSQIAKDKQNVIFAMEEPETAIPPHSQKRIVHEVKKLSAQSLFTSHSPYVLEEFSIEETVALSRDDTGVMKRNYITLPENVKYKRYRQEFRTRFCEGLLARRVLLAEGATEADAFPAVSRRLYEIDPDTFSPIEALGVCVVNAGGETEIPGLAKLYADLGKRVYALCDQQTPEATTEIENAVDHLFMHTHTGFEQLVLNNTTEAALSRFAASLDWPQHLIEKYGNPQDDPSNALMDYFKWSKGDKGVTDFLVQCEHDEIPEWLRNAVVELRQICNPNQPAEQAVPEEDHDGTNG